MRRGKKKSKKTGDDTETSDGVESPESSSSLTSATPASSLASSPDPKSLASEIDCGLPSKEEISAPPNLISFSAFSSSPSEPLSER